MCGVTTAAWLWYFWRWYWWGRGPPAAEPVATAGSRYKSRRRRGQRKAFKLVCTTIFHSAGLTKESRHPSTQHLPLSESLTSALVLCLFHPFSVSLPPFPCLTIYPPITHTGITALRSDAIIRLLFNLSSLHFLNSKNVMAVVMCPTSIPMIPLATTNCLPYHRVAQK